MDEVTRFNEMQGQLTCEADIIFWNNLSLKLNQNKTPSYEVITLNDCLYPIVVSFESIIVKKERVENLPEFIYRTKNGKKFEVRFKNKYERFSRAYNTLEEAEARVAEYRLKIAAIKAEEEALADPITRNSNGIAMIKVRNVEVLVDDEKWHDLMTYSWMVKASDGNIVSRLKDNTLIYMKKLIMPVAEGCDVTYINECKYDNRLSNLKVSDKREEIKHVGVRLSQLKVTGVVN